MKTMNAAGQCKSFSGIPQPQGLKGSCKESFMSKEIESMSVGDSSEFAKILGPLEYEGDERYVRLRRKQIAGINNTA